MAHKTLDGAWSFGGTGLPDLRLRTRFTDKCALCGEEIVMRCHREDWGYQMESPSGKGIIVFCKWEHEREYLRRDLFAAAKRKRISPARFEEMRGLWQKGWRFDIAARKLGMKETEISFWWDWFDEHKEEAAK